MTPTDRYCELVDSNPRVYACLHFSTCGSVVQMIPAVFSMVQRLSSVGGLVVASIQLIAFVCERVAQLFADADCPDKRTEAEAALQLALQPDAALSAHVREYMLSCLQFDPVLHGLLHAVAAAAHCDGACTPQAVDALVAGVQPGADQSQVHWLHDAATNVCTRTVPPATQACACRRALLNRLIRGPDWAAVCRMHPKTSITLASQPPGTQGRRFVVAARLIGNCDVSRVCCAPRCTLHCAADNDTLSCYLKTYRVSEQLPYQSGSLDTDFGLVRASADAFASLASTARAWVNDASRPRKAVLLGHGSGWTTTGETINCSEAEYRLQSWGMIDSFAPKVACELGYAITKWNDALTESLWVFVAGEEVEDAPASS